MKRFDEPEVMPLQWCSWSGAPEVVLLKWCSWRGPSEVVILKWPSWSGPPEVVLLKWCSGTGAPVVALLKKCSWSGASEVANVSEMAHVPEVVLGPTHDPAGGIRYPGLIINKIHCTYYSIAPITPWLQRKIPELLMIRHDSTFRRGRIHWMYS